MNVEVQYLIHDFGHRTIIGIIAPVHAFQMQRALACVRVDTEQRVVVHTHAAVAEFPGDFIHPLLNFLSVHHDLFGAVIRRLQIAIPLRQPADCAHIHLAGHAAAAAQFAVETLAVVRAAVDRYGSIVNDDRKIVSVGVVIRYSILCCQNAFRGRAQAGGVADTADVLCADASNFRIQAAVPLYDAIAIGQLPNADDQPRFRIASAGLFEILGT